MKRRGPDLDPELEAFLEHRTVERRVPPEIRARTLARARAILSAGAVGSPEPAPPLQAPVPVAPGHGRFRIALAVAVAVACIAVGAAAALRARSDPAPRVTSPASPPSLRSIAAARIDAPALEAAVPDATPVVAPTPVHPARPLAKQDSLTAELDLLQRAHAAYTRREFTLALGLVAEHTRRFPRGRLAEQREALRVRSLVGSGRVHEAHRAAAAFAARFPRSVLLPQLTGSTESSEP